MDLSVESSDSSFVSFLTASWEETDARLVMMIAEGDEGNRPCLKAQDNEDHTLTTAELTRDQVSLLFEVVPGGSVT